jgi:hypothetical protein
MQSEVTAALITGIIAIISPLTTYFLTRAYDRRELGKIEGRRKAIIGAWKGDITQTFLGETSQITIEMAFTAGKKIIEGHANLIHPVTSELTRLKFTGGFYHDRFIKFDYKNENETIMQFGSAVVDLSSDGKTLNGKYVGYGSKTNQIVSGDVCLKRAT